MSPVCANCGGTLAVEKVEGQEVIFCPACGGHERKEPDDAGK